MKSIKAKLVIAICVIVTLLSGGLSLVSIIRSGDILLGKQKTTLSL